MSPGRRWCPSRRLPLLPMLMMTRIFLASLWLFNIATRTAALNANKNSGFTTYNDRWRAFEVVTQGDQVGTYTFPGQLDGIGVSVAKGVAVCYFINVRILWISIAALLRTGVPPQHHTYPSFSQP